MTINTDLTPRRVLTVALLLLLSAGVGCSGSTPTAEPAAPSSVIVQTPTPTPTPVETEEPSEEPVDEECTSVTSTDGLFLYKGWERVVASRGASDHRHYVDSFADEAKDLTADARHDGACTDIGVTVAKLSLEAAVLVANVLIGSGEAKTSEYKLVADAGNVLMTELDVDEEFGTRYTG